MRSGDEREHLQQLRVVKVYAYGQVLEEWAAVIGSGRTSHGLVWYLVELAEPPGVPK